MMSPVPGPVFIGGLAHSGKSQLRRVISAHPHIAMTRRTYLWTKFYDRFGDLNRPRNLERCLAAMLGDEEVQNLAPDPERIRREFSEGAAGYARLFGIVHAHHAQRLGKPRWGDQLGMVGQFADPIFSEFPTARMIHMIRDPRRRRGGGTEPDHRRRGKAGWETARWLHSVELARRNEQWYAGRYLVLKFEDLAAQPEPAMARVFAFLNEEFTEPARQELFGITFGEPVGSASPGEPPGPALSGAEAYFVQMYGRPYLRDLGYPVESSRRSRLRRAMFYTFDWPVLRSGMAAWRLTNRAVIT